MLHNGHTVAHYQIGSLLGVGGMGEVYLADDVRHQRRVALKLLRPEVAHSLGSERFLREIEIASRLRHPHILPVYDSGDVDGALFFVMPLVEGESLRARLNREKQLPLDHALRITHEVGDALSYAHAHGVVHRDIKPENILLESGHAVVADFGIARASSAAGTERLTGTGISLGTPTYMSPEQAAGDRNTDGRSDLYSLACVLFEMLAGEPPFTGPTPQSIIHQHCVSEPRSITSLRPAVPSGVAVAIARALAKTPADRFDTVGQFTEALTRAQTAPAAIVSRPRSHAWLAVALGLVLLLGVAWFTTRSHDAPVEVAMTAPLDQKYVVAVLPFENLSADSARSYFAAGMTEEITGQLSRLSALRVLGRNALTSYTDATDRIPRMVKDLGVGSIVEGTVRVEGNRARVGVQLIDGRSRQTIWTEQYDRELVDVFGVQRDIAQRITTALQASLTPAEARRAGRPQTINLAAYELYMRAGDLSRFNVTQNLASIKILRQAVARDSTFAAAYAELARRFLFLGYSRGPAYFDSGLVAAKKAVAADPELAQAHFALGGIQGISGRLAAERVSYRKTLQLDPNYAWAMMDLSINEDYLGHYDESLYWAMRAAPLDPASAVTYYHVSVPLLRLGDDLASERFLVRAARRFPDNVRLESALSMLDLGRGRDTSAMERARRMVARDPENQEGQAYLAELAVVTRAPDAEALVKPLAEAGPDTRPLFLYETFRTLYAWTLAERGERARADSMWDAALAQDRKDLADGNEMFDRSLEIAAISAVRGELSNALEWLERAYQRGFKDPRVLARDPFFDGIRAHPQFQRIAARMQEDVVAMRRRAVAAHDTLFTPTVP
jgi:eukaryotic-like serine/threonine-protein kinase